MSLITTIDLESNNINTEFPEFVSGTNNIVTSATVTIPQGTYALQIPFSASQNAQRSYTPVPSVYVLMKMQVNITSNPVTTAADLDLMVLKTAAAATIAYLNIGVSTAGVITLRLFQNLASFSTIATTTITNNTWYDVAVRMTRAGAGSSVLELRVIDSATGGPPTLIGGSSTLDLSTTDPGRIGMAATGTLNSITGNVYYDWIILDNAAYPAYTVPALTANVGESLGVNDVRYQQV